MNKYQKKCLSRTYSQAQEMEPFDWLKALKKVKPKEIDTLIDLTDLASEWTTCACGNQCDILERNEEGRPSDPRLAQLGTRFFQEIDKMKFYAKAGTNTKFDTQKQKALNTLRMIEERSAHLINIEVFTIEVRNIIIDPILKAEIKEEERLQKLEKREITGDTW